ncbi:uncharacterized protein TNCV_1718091 [Trichonephila clavipes]|nr:uncharacterized protein TNCV_1718091 [Trichonephila clavipes]
MAFLLRERKDVLLEVAKELRVEIDITLPKIEFKKRICQSEDYNEESVKSLLEGILAEKQEARELKERQEARELKERQKTREYELERLRLSNATETVSVSSADLEGQGAGDKRKVAEDRWVSQLIPLLPIEIAEIVAKEPLEKSDDYPHIKNLLLARFQLTPIALRDRFESHQRRPGAMWADLVFELRSYLDNWLAGMKGDSWDGFKEAKSLAEKLDHFEAIRRVHKKTGPTKTWERRTFDKQPLESKNNSAHFSGKGKNIGPLNRDPYKHEKEKEANEAEFELTDSPPSEGGEDDSFIIPAFEGEGGKSLAKVNGVEFKEEQRKCPDLKPLWDKALTEIDKEFRVIRGKLVRVAKTKRGVEVNGDQPKVEIKDMILQNDKNDMETIKAVTEGILEEKEREFELEKLRIRLRNKLNENKLKAGNRINELANVCILSGKYTAEVSESVNKCRPLINPVVNKSVENATSRGFEKENCDPPVRGKEFNVNRSSDCDVKMKVGICEGRVRTVAMGAQRVINPVNIGVGSFELKRDKGVANPEGLICENSCEKNIPLGR